MTDNHSAEGSVMDKDGQHERFPTTGTFALQLALLVEVH